MHNNLKCIWTWRISIIFHALYIHNFEYVAAHLSWWSYNSNSILSWHHPQHIRSQSDTALRTIGRTRPCDPRACYSRAQHRDSEVFQLRIWLWTNRARIVCEAAPWCACASVFVCVVFWLRATRVDSKNQFLFYTRREQSGFLMNVYVFVCAYTCWFVCVCGVV